MRRASTAVIPCLLVAGAWASIAWAQPPVAPTTVEVPVAPAVAAPAPPATLSTTPPAAVTAVLPPVQYAGTVAGEELFNLLRADARFAALDRELVGSPILLRVTHGFEPTAGGKAAGLASAILAGSTLGLLPLVTNSDLVITYEFVVNGTPVTTYKYRRNFTRSQNIFATDTTYGLGADGLAWAKSTAGEFLGATGKDEKLAALLAEYEFYFGKPGP